MHLLRRQSLPGRSLMFARLSSSFSRFGLRADFGLGLVGAAVVFGFVAPAARAQNVYTTPYTITTLAGLITIEGSADGTGPAARFFTPSGITVDASGTVYVADNQSHTIRKITPGGVVTTFAGLAGVFGSTDGIGTAARFTFPYGLAIDANGNVYVADSLNHAIRKITPGGLVTTLAGLLGSSGVTDGTGAGARFQNPRALAVDANGTVYVVEFGHHRIRRITSAGVVTVFAGELNAAGSADGTGVAARFRNLGPSGVAVDGAGIVYIYDSGNFTIRRITPGGVVTTLAGLAGVAGLTDATGTAARLGLGYAITADAAGNVYFFDSPNYSIRRSSPVGVVTTLAGVFGGYGTADGTGSAAQFFAAVALAIDASGTLYIADGNSIRVGTAAAPPIVIGTQPVSQTVAVGASVTFLVSVTGGVPTYQWLKNGVAIAGATSATLALSSVGASDAASYSVVVSNAAGSVTSNVATLSFVVSTVPRLINLSILTQIPAAGDSFTMGYVVGGSGTTGTKPLVIRAAGPSLVPLGVPGTLNDPRIELFAGPASVGTNDNWGGAAALSAAMAAVGAFAYTGPASLDAAIATNISTADNSVKVSAAGSGTGTVIAEIYDATPPASFFSFTPRLVNVSVLKHLGTGVTVGFVIGGTGTKGVLIRAVGPTLGAAPFNVPGVVADPQLSLFGTGLAAVGTNDNWGGTAALTAAFSSVGAFALPGTSRDAALVATLAPGNYTVQVSGVGGTTGVAIVEVYELP